MKDEIVGSAGDTGKMYAELVIFIIGCIPVLLCVICFAAAGWIYIGEGETELMRRWMIVGSILGWVSFMLVMGSAMASRSMQPTEDDDEVLPD